MDNWTFNYINTTSITADSSIQHHPMPHQIVSQPLRIIILETHGILRRVVINTSDDFENMLTMKDAVSEMTISENACNDMDDNLVLSEFANLRSIVVKKNSMKNVNRLTINNCDVLESFIVEDGDNWNAASKTGSAPFEKTKSVILTSMLCKH